MVTFYVYHQPFFFQLDPEPTCITVQAERFWPVANMTIHHKIRIFDYYEPGRYNYSLYESYDLFNLNICKVCGSFQCPYCLWYNRATNLLRPRIVLLTALVIIAMFFSRGSMPVSSLFPS